MGRKLSNTVATWLDLQIKTTRKSYRGVMLDLLTFLKPGVLLEDVQPNDLVLYIKSVEERKTVKSPATVNKHIKTVRTFFNWAVEAMQFITINPARVLKRRLTSTYIRREKAMSEEELKMVIAHVRKRIEVDTEDMNGNIVNIDRYRDLALLLFLADTGARRRGAVELKLTDLDLKSNAAIVTEKFNKERTVVFGDECAEALKQWLHMRSKWLIQNDSALKNIYVFSRSGEQLTAYSLGEAFRRMCKRAGIRSLGPHSLRHRKGHQLQKKTDAATAALALGHSSPTITLQYYYKHDTSQAENVLRELAVTTEQPKMSVEVEQGKIIQFPKAASE
jgi:site-specific recombinase XerD